MSSTDHKLRSRRGLIIILLSITLTWIPLFRLGGRVQAQEGPGIDVSSASATLKSRGVLVEWRCSDKYNLGFNVYRLQAGQRTLLNGQVIGGAAFTTSGRHVAPLGDYPYSFFDPTGTADSTYEIESVDMFGQVRTHKAVATVRNNTSGPLTASASSSPEIPPAEFNRPSQEIPGQLNTPAGPIDDQWAIANRICLKISIKQDGWYRVTQQQMATAGFAPPVDVRNLQLFTNAREVPIQTSKDVDQFSSGDFIEFYAQALDTPTTDTRIYYLVAGTSAGKRIVGSVQRSGSPDAPVPTSPAPLAAAPDPERWYSWLLEFYSGDTTPSESTAAVSTVDKRVSRPAETGPPKLEGAVTPSNSDVDNELKGRPSAAVADNTITTSSEAKSTVVGRLHKEPSIGQTAPTAAHARSTRRFKKRRHKRKARSHHNHAVASPMAAAVSFNTTALLKERYRNDAQGFIPNYFVLLLNGDTENYFGRVVGGTAVTQTINTPNPEPTADGPAKLEVALQGIAGVFFFSHSYEVRFNGTLVTTVNFGPLDHPIRKIDIPIPQLLNGPNTVTFTRVSTNDVILIDYVSITYPHALKADNNSLRFSLRSTQAAKIDGFAGQNVRLIDYTDLFAVKVTHPATEPTTAGYNIAISPGAPSKYGRLLYAIPDTQFATPAALALNQPSTINATTNGADLLIIAHKSLIPSAAPLVSLRQSQGMMVSVVDIEDVYDEFSYGAHGPQSIKDFLFRAKSSWTTKPKYVIFLGDSDLDPRNYEGVGEFDLVPTKLVDATYNETASDDWLSDFDNDGIGEIPSGRLPVRTPAEANLAISKIVNFAPTNAPQSALLVADDPTNYYFNFEIANDEVEAQLHSLVPSMTVQRINRRTDPNSHDHIITEAFGSPILPLPPGQGQSLVNYSGHGNVNTWTGANIFTSIDASASANGNKLPLVLVMNCLNGYFQDPRLDGIAEALIKAPNGGAVAVFASSGETIPDGQHDMNRRLFLLIYGSPTLPLGDAIKDAKTYTTDIDVRRTWILFGDPSMKIR
jgi:hypothetical protein